MTTIQFFLILFFLFALLKVTARFRGGEIKFLNALVWVLFWLLASTVVLIPGLAIWLAKFLGVGRGVDAVIYLAIAVLFFLVFRLLVRLEKLEKNLTRLVRQDALSDKNK
ncbi:MAG: DUF2304 domain-containing protein [Candidatus Magasanikbacteria bacterium]|nr:DUF2304 domain-containing protein [Candidatus Magasanikbacteria bacterium]